MVTGNNFLKIILSQKIQYFVGYEEYALVYKIKKFNQTSAVLLNFGQFDTS